MALAGTGILGLVLLLLPADGIFYSPFGWGFYSPIFIYHSPYFYGGNFGHPHAFGDFHGPYGHGLSRTEAFMEEAVSTAAEDSMAVVAAEVVAAK